MTSEMGTYKSGGWGGDPFGSPAGGDPFGNDPFGRPPTITGGTQTPPLPRESNTLATLSVVFAFVFAPAGAVLGHLGLSQIRRTGQRGRERALIGITLSYTVITIAVVALVVWGVTAGQSTPGVTATPPAATATSSAPRSTSPSTRVPSTTPPPTISVTPPPPQPGPTMAASDLPGVLLSLDEVKRNLADDPNTAYGSNLTEGPSRTELETSPGAQGSVEPAECIPAVIAGSDAAYRDSGYQAIYLRPMTQAGDGGDLSIVQSVAMFADADAAYRALTNYMTVYSKCFHLMNPYLARPLAFTFTEPSGRVIGLFGASQLGVINAVPPPFVAATGYRRGEKRWSATATST